MVKIKKQLVGSTSFAYGRNNKKMYITVHETGNTEEGASAQMHANLQSNGNSRAAAWHWQVDDVQAIQSFAHDWQLWHAGDSRGNGNLNSIAIEICVNSDGDYNKAIHNAAELIKHIMDQETISESHIVQHNHWSGKNCPHYLRNGAKGPTWLNLMALVHGSGGHIDHKPQTSASHTSKPKPKPKANLVVDGKWGVSTVRALQKAMKSKYHDGEFSGQYHNAVTNAFYGGIKFGSGGSPSVKLLQRKVRSSADGLLGPTTIKALQKHLGTPQDGVISRPVSTVVKSLQKALNKGAF